MRWKMFSKCLVRVWLLETCPRLNDCFIYSKICACYSYSFGSWEFGGIFALLPFALLPFSHCFMVLGPSFFKFLVLVLVYALIFSLIYQLLMFWVWTEFGESLPYFKFWYRHFLIPVSILIFVTNFKLNLTTFKFHSC